jgi:hypothetical protein
MNIQDLVENPMSYDNQEKLQKIVSQLMEKSSTGESRLNKEKIKEFLAITQTHYSQDVLERTKPFLKGLLKKKRRCPQCGYKLAESTVYDHKIKGCPSMRKNKKTALLIQKTTDK